MSHLSMLQEAPCNSSSSTTPPIRQTLGYYSTRLDWTLSAYLQREEFLLVVTDIFSRWVECFPISSSTTAIIVRLLEQEVLHRFGFPQAILSDNGSQFASQGWKAACIKWKVRHWSTFVYHPRANPTERRNQEIKTGLRMYLESGEHRNWDTHLSKILFDQRGRRNAATGTTPYYALFGRPLLRPGEWENVTEDGNVIEPPTFRERVDDIRRHQREYQQQRAVPESEVHRYRPHQLVYSREHSLSSAEQNFHAGFAPRWSGPHTVHSYVGGNTY
ncbi:uncharacterized protein K02A2.6-like [Agrilus planipennis]|uniref:Uncharacterized protein K02A2.6-like n=1 Tax=Agrilus planipennis TaxID=224129 RepID=A0A1W4X2G5_AGRPL|nr:uncharacterized protein K02A2.6-like [Agrilus planipennis]